VHNGPCPATEPAPLLVTTINSAELIKHASNSFLALKISYANVIADLCEKIGANVEEVTHAMGLDPRIGGQFLKAGLGFGGFCFPKDVQAFIHLSASVGVDFAILKAAEKVNKQRIDRYFDKVRKALWVLKGKNIAVLGLAFKPNTDDIRFAPRWKWSSAYSMRASTFALAILKPWNARNTCSRRSSITKILLRLSAARMPRCSALSGMFFARSTGCAPENLWPASWSSMGEILFTGSYARIGL